MHLRVFGNDFFQQNRILFVADTFLTSFFAFRRFASQQLPIYVDQLHRIVTWLFLNFVCGWVD
tara:strand:- start:167 stop:355 length:189 start_codon:yes stop_codon:yes gene_type:complete